MGEAAVGYVRARVVPYSTSAEDGAISAQMRAISTECERRGWILDEIFVDRGASANDPNRPGLIGALTLLGAGDHIALIVTELDRLTRETSDFLALQTTAAAAGWHVVVAGRGEPIAHR
jgi:DNA invertase Pin-like site-specific DNA recombinase